VEEVIEVTLRVTGVFEDLGIPYLVGGSLASSLHGKPRATQDVDLVADLQTHHVPGLVQALRDEFYLDEPAIRDAVDRRSTFNVIHLGTLFKVDVFVAGDDPPIRRELERRQRWSPRGSPRSVPVRHQKSSTMAGGRRARVPSRAASSVRPSASSSGAARSATESSRPSAQRTAR
jgi:hypothetical protein